MAALALFRLSTTAARSFRWASVASILLMGGAAYAGGMSGVQTDSYALPGVAQHGMPIGILQQIVIDKGPSVNKPAIDKKMPDAVGGVRIVDTGHDVLAHAQTPEALTPAPVVPFDPAIYSVYGVLTSSGAVSAIVGLVGGDAQIVRIGDLIGDTAAVVTDIEPDGIGVKLGRSSQIEHIGFYGGDRLAPSVRPSAPASMPSTQYLKPLPPL